MALRSISLPSRLDPTSLKIEDHLNKLKSFQQEPISTSSLQSRLVALSNLYSSFTDLLQNPSTKHALIPHNTGKLLIQQTLEGSVSLMNTCSSSRDLVSSLKAHVRDLQSALRRSSGVDCHVAAYVGFRKKSSKEVVKCAKELKQVEQSKWVEVDDTMINRVFREVARASIETFGSVVAFLAVKSWRSGGARWPRISRMLAAKDEDVVGDVAAADLAVWSMQSGGRKEELDVQRRLRVLDCGSQSLEGALEMVFRSMVHNRVSLLNILTH